ncbi:Early nodulin-like protein 1 [Ananas comosus]|uniref:Early nodulin-like protein 1 n=1 Tax=Ananas comosus TaxID=4615 RepID=A0A199W5E0_ANACO|nr:Early nodulin-like protein 1 [Ananas comosus]
MASPYFGRRPPLGILAAAVNRYKVGDAAGWRLPDDNNIDMYKNWASKITFHVGDSLCEVDKRGYYHCNESGRGSMFKDGNTLFVLDEPGFCYFVSGDVDHCRKGQRLMVEVAGQQRPPPLGPPVPVMAGPSPAPLPSAAALREAFAGIEFWLFVMLRTYLLRWFYLQ